MQKRDDLGPVKLNRRFLAEIGAGKGLTAKEQAGVVKEAVRSVVYDADSRRLKINRIESPVNGDRTARRSD